MHQIQVELQEKSPSASKQKQEEGTVDKALEELQISLGGGDHVNGAEVKLADTLELFK